MSIRKKLNANAVPIQMPIISSDDIFVGVVDLIGMKSIHWPPRRENDSVSRTAPMPKVELLKPSNPLYSDALKKRKGLLESLAEEDDEFLEFYCAQGDTIIEETGPTNEDIHFIIKHIKKACVSGKIVPVVCGASLRGVGVQPVLDSILVY